MPKIGVFLIKDFSTNKYFNKGYWLDINNADEYEDWEVDIMYYELAPNTSFMKIKDNGNLVQEIR